MPPPVDAPMAGPALPLEVQLEQLRDEFAAFQLWKTAQAEMATTMLQEQRSHLADARENAVFRKDLEDKVAEVIVSMNEVREQSAESLRMARRSRDVVDNTPLLLVRQGGELLHDNLRAARINPRDVYAKLRQANVTRLSDVHAVVLEPTGDISVLHGDGDLDPALLDGVRDQA